MFTLSYAQNAAFGLQRPAKKSQPDNKKEIRALVS